MEQPGEHPATILVVETQQDLGPGDRAVPGDPGDAALVSASIGLGHTLGLKVMAKGVETETHIAFLNQHGCCEAQGFLIGKPMPAEALSAFIARAA